MELEVDHSIWIWPFVWLTLSMHRCYPYVNRPVIASPQAPCDTHPCKNGGTCYPSNGKYDFRCVCTSGFSGKTCHIGKLVINRFNEHRRPIIKPFCSYTPTAVSRHFLISGHAEDHMILIPLEQLHTSRDSIRKAREAFLIHRGKTLEPAGLNRRDEM